MTHDIRRSIRLQGYEYTQQGAYFVTVCTYAHTCRFGAGVDGEMALNHLGRLSCRSGRTRLFCGPMSNGMLSS